MVGPRVTDRPLSLVNPAAETELHPTPGTADTAQIQSKTMLAWERFLSGVPLTDVPVSEHLGASWQRSVTSGVCPTNRAAPLAARGDDMSRLRWRHRELMKAASAIFAVARDLLTDSNTIMLLTTPEGIVLETVGDMHTLESGQDIHLMEGGDWRESSVGTNGIGTAIATRRPVQVHAAEHFCEGIKAWTCAAAPICDPLTGTLVGVVDISGPPQTYQRNNLTLAVAAARQIELILAECAMNERMRLLEVCLQQLTGRDAAAMLALDRHGRFVHTSGCVPVTLDVGAQLPGIDECSPIDEWGRQLPDGLRAEWLNPVTIDGKRIGAMIVVPSRSRPAAASRVIEHGSEVDPERSSFGHIVGRSAAMLATIERGRQLACKLVPILIQGETGVGKELFARAIHGESGASKPFIAFNCGAATKELIAGELFGHVRGAFTGATSEGRPGRFELANGGTLCLDEIGELPLDLQPVLLRVLEEGIVYRLGDSQPRRVNVRLLSLTNRNLRDEVEAGRFRRDLYYRIGVTQIRIPPLRERDIDIDLLIEHFNRNLAQRHDVQELRFSAEAKAAVRAYSWPGNARELRNVVESLLLTSNADIVNLSDLPPELLESVDVRAASSSPMPSDSLEQAERTAIARALHNARGNLAQAARLLGVSRSTLYRKVELYRLEDIVK
ncbi:sigma-54-dependent Fis family transcriptional regulator [Burkholderia anthina]|uniref:sigma-54-dependent Fis family transcriptional regulator n=1 Tax=Burkholderia anthina TaxID=179879 RepID=UPI00158C78EF|nr:sigma-54-dependent Fis family transcriptional regulator [Burkholderia anthina]